MPDVKKVKQFFVEINQTPTPFFVTEIKASGKNLILTFDSITTIEAAQKIINCGVWLEEKSIKKQVSAKDLGGYLLNDKNKGNLGAINGLIDLPGQQMLSISINEQEVLLPFTDDLVIKIDHKTKTIFYDTPDGLIDIYTS